MSEELNQLIEKIRNSRGSKRKGDDKFTLYKLKKIAEDNGITKYPKGKDDLIDFLLDKLNNISISQSEKEKEDEEERIVEEKVKLVKNLSRRSVKTSKITKKKSGEKDIVYEKKKPKLGRAKPTVDVFKEPKKSKKESKKDYKEVDDEEVIISGLMGEEDIEGEREIERMDGESDIEFEYRQKIVVIIEDYIENNQEGIIKEGKEELFSKMVISYLKYKCKYDNKSQKAIKEIIEKL